MSYGLNIAARPSTSAQDRDDIVAGESLLAANESTHQLSGNMTDWFISYCEALNRAESECFAQFIGPIRLNRYGRCFANHPSFGSQA